MVSLEPRFLEVSRGFWMFHDVSQILLAWAQDRHNDGHKMGITWQHSPWILSTSNRRTTGLPADLQPVLKKIEDSGHGEG